MQINLPFGRELVIGKRKSAVIVRNEQGNVTGVQRNFTLEKVDEYLDCFQPSVFAQNFVFMYGNIAEVYFPIHYLTSRIKNANFVLKRWDDDTVVWSDVQGMTPKDRIVGERMKKFLSRPNTMQTFREFVEMAFVYQYLVGETFIYAATIETDTIVKNKWQYCDNYWVLPAQSIDIDTGYKVPMFGNAQPNDVIKGYKLTSQYGNTEFPTDLVLHMKDNAELCIGTDYFRGRSRLMGQKYPISNLCAAYEARNAIYVKRGALGAIVNMKKDIDSYVSMTDDEKKNIRSEFQQTYGVTNKRDPLAIIDIPVSYINFGMSIADMQPFDETLNDAVTIAGAYGIDGVLVPRKDQATFSNLKEAECKVYTSAIIPDVKAFCESLSEFMGLNEAGYYLDALWDDIEVLQEARMRKEMALRSVSERAKSEFKGGLITLNQWRALENRERIDNPLYDKTILEMTDEEFESIISRIEIK
ncbi:MAG: phage portal protein [Bacteroidales bacterium]|nr:phage portal protein [Bacteroidales bacterium]